MKKIAILLLGLTVVFAACEEPSDPVGVFDRGAMLTHYADQIIVPAYDDLLVEVEALEAAVENVINNPGMSTLSQAQVQYKATLEAWQSANAFNFGPAGEEGLNKSLVEEIGTFPVSTAKVDGFIAADDTSLANFDRDSRGLYAVGYLLYGLPGTQDILVNFQDPIYGAYLRAVVRDIRRRVSAVFDAWNSGYKTDFTSRIGTDVGSGTSQFYNEFVRSFEAIKNFKVGLPAGKRPGQMSPEPNLVESRFAMVSRELLGRHLETTERIYKGQSKNGTDGKGLIEYVEAVEGGPALRASTLEQWTKVLDAYNALPAGKSLQELAAEDAPELDAFHTELQKHTRFFKSDMSSILGIAITFASGDGD